jgi:hypothetical protein
MKVDHSKFIKMHGDASDFYRAHWFHILDTELILRSIELLIYLQTYVNINAYN